MGSEMCIRDRAVTTRTDAGDKFRLGRTMDEGVLLLGRSTKPE